MIHSISCSLGNSENFLGRTCILPLIFQCLFPTFVFVPRIYLWLASTNVKSFYGHKFFAVVVVVVVVVVGNLRLLVEGSF